FLLKRKGDWKAAISLWEQAAENSGLYAFEELAKYYEHQVKDLETALQWTEGALEILKQQHIPVYEYHQWQENLHHRLERLMRRLEQ
ncbi:MAG: hypothetical protein ACK2TV_03660, partial [Anaerolineales bacterium]